MAINAGSVNGATSSTINRVTLSGYVAAATQNRGPDTRGEYRAEGQTPTTLVSTMNARCGM